MPELLLKILEPQRANQLAVRLRGACPLNRNYVLNLQRLLQKAEKVLAVLDAQFHAKVSERL